VLDEDWAETLTIDLKFQTSKEFLELPSPWHCAEGICAATMKQLNDEFNLFRSLFPLKVYIGGPPASGKTFYSKRLADSYGIPHLMIGDMIKYAMN
jgi:2-phosphoglycerate kinase